MAIDDALEENDTCLTAGMGQLASAGLFVSQADEDFYSYTLQAGEIIDVNLAYINANGDIDAQLIDGGDCTTILDDAN